MIIREAVVLVADTTTEAGVFVFSPCQVKEASKLYIETARGCVIPVTMAEAMAIAESEIEIVDGVPHYFPEAA